MRKTVSPAVAIVVIVVVVLIAVVLFARAARTKRVQVVPGMGVLDQKTGRIIGRGGRGARGREARGAERQVPPPGPMGR